MREVRNFWCLAVGSLDDWWVYFMPRILAISVEKIINTHTNSFFVRILRVSDKISHQSCHSRRVNQSLGCMMKAHCLMWRNENLRIFGLNDEHGDWREQYLAVNRSWTVLILDFNTWLLISLAARQELEKKSTATVNRTISFVYTGNSISNVLLNYNSIVHSSYFKSCLSIRYERTTSVTG